MLGKTALGIDAKILLPLVINNRPGQRHQLFLSGNWPKNRHKGKRLQQRARPNAKKNKIKNASLF